jgi:hypothetical protein
MYEISDEKLIAEEDAAFNHLQDLIKEEDHERKIADEHIFKANNPRKAGDAPQANYDAQAAKSKQKVQIAETRRKDYQRSIRDLLKRREKRIRKERAIKHGDYVGKQIVALVISTIIASIVSGCMGCWGSVGAVVLDWCYEILTDKQ